MADTASKHIDMTTGSLWRNIPLFAFPVAATSILEQLSNLIATVIIGNFSGDQGTLAMAAVGSNVPLTSLMINLFIGCRLAPTWSSPTPSAATIRTWSSAPSIPRF